MKKLTLDTEALRVESFEPHEGDAGWGTVRGHVDTRHGETCMTQCATGLCDCMLTIPPEVGC